MLYFLAQHADQFGPLNLFRYLTFRTGGAVLTALLVSFILGPVVIGWLKSRRPMASPSATMDRNGISSPSRARRQWAAS